MLSKDEKELKRYEKFLETLHIEFSPVRDMYVDTRKIPAFTESFEPYMTPMEFYDSYVNNNPLDPIVSDSRHREGVYARAMRAYTSLIREHHLFLLLRTKFPLVVRTKEVDKSWGVDYLILWNNVYLPVRAYVDSAASRNYADRKKRRIGKLPLGHVVDLPLDFDKATQIGEIYVYNDELLAPLYETFGEEPNEESINCV